MNINNSLQLKQTQKLVMTPRLLQRIQILQMPLNELLTEVQTQILENPVIEIRDDDPAGPDAVPTDAAAESGSEDAGGIAEASDEKYELLNPEPKEGDISGAEEKTKEQPLESDGVSDYEKELETVEIESENNEIDWEQYYDDLEKTTHLEEKEFEWSEQASFEVFAFAEKTLCDHLQEQLNAAVFSDREFRIGKVIIGYIDSGGYLKASTEEIAAHADLKDENIAAGEINDLIEIIQSFDPSGVCARDAAECLLLQYQALEDDTPRPEHLEEILRNHLFDISEKKYRNVAHALSITVEQVQECVDFIIKNFNPRPGLKYASSADNSVVAPEVFIEKNGEDYVVTVNDYDIPRIRLNPRYEKILRSKNSTPEVIAFIKEKLDKARFILKSIEQRRDTIKKVVECIVRNQRDFFEHGVSHFKPLILNEVANEVGLDESTVSRVTSGKYAQTPRGVLELKFFFSAGLRTAKGEDVSTKSVKDMIKQMVLKEPAAKPYSDQAIVNALAEKGIQIARRTVTKYREEMKISSASKRKRFD
jgi:RNA polymerase sigma-54 factor